MSFTGVFKMSNPYCQINPIDVLLVASMLNVILVYTGDSYMSCYSTKEAAVTCSDSFVFGSVDGSLIVDRNLVEDLFIEVAEICFLF